MARPPRSTTLTRGLVVTLSALTVSMFAAAPSALAASSHANSHASDKSSTQSSSSDHSKGNASTTGDSTKPQPVSNADSNSGGANGQCPDGPYCSTRDGSASGNGNGGGKATGKPCAGCVGKADNKNPKGQMPNGSDNNAGYECDRNHGIGRGNPAHTGCTSGGTTDCTTNPTAEGCTGGDTDCTTNPTAEGCGGTDVCTTLPDLPQCVTGSSDCTSAFSTETCTAVLGEKTTRTPATKPTTAVLGESVTRTPSGALPFTGANIALLTGIALLTLGFGAALTLSARRRNSTSS